MNTLKIILVIVIVLIILVVIVYAYYGGFKTITFRVEEQGGETIVYEEMIGDYSQTPKVQDKVYHALLNDEKIETTKGFGIYYDNPKEVEKSKLRSEIGCIVEGLDSTAIAKLTEKYKVKTLPKSNCIVTEFPYKGVVSVFIGIMKVYPAFEKYCKQHGLSNSPMIEIYDIPNKKIIYRKEK
ncbi:MAG: GyrI-like domain-containing protein [Dysgonamonadaceae bacterium]|jgi:ABC-type lipoprotein release transport system permease subunit|nr:GyrI-like domain-containing protein [Dysgonamonadaceae bacterium]